MRRSHLFALVFTALALAMLVGSAAATRRQEPFSITGAQLAALRASGRVATPTRATSGPSLVAVNVAWAGDGAGTPVTVGANHFTFGTDAFASVQAGIAAVAAGGTVWVLPGTYLETAPNSYIFNGEGPYQFGVFVGQAKPGITVQGVNALGGAITSAASVATTINYDATNSFGTSGFFVEADHVTFAGLGIGSQKDMGFVTNKTFEVLGDDFTLRNCAVNDNNAGSIYIDDWRATMTSSYVQSYHVLDNLFADDNSVDVASGPGINGAVSGRVISGNAFVMSDIYNSITFNGTGGGADWDVYPVGGAIVTGNTFTNTNATGTIIKARGQYDNSQFDWASYWNGNTFNRATCEGVAPPANLRPYDTSSYTNARRIEATVQGEVDKAQAGDVVLVHAGSYTEQVVVNGKNVKIQGAGLAATTIQSPPTLTASYTTGAANFPVVLLENTPDAELSGVTVDGMGVGNANYRFQGVGFWNAGGKVTSCRVTRIRETPFNGDQHGVGIYAYNVTGGPYAIEIGNCTLDDWQKGGIVMNATGLTASVHDCTVTGQGPTALNAENGIQFGYGAGGSITNCTVSGCNYTVADDNNPAVACGLLLFTGPGVTVTGGSVSGCQYGAYFQDMTGGMSATSIAQTGALGGYPPCGTQLYNTLASAPQTGARRAGAIGSHVPLPASPMVDDLAGNGSTRYPSTSAPMVVTLANGCLTGSGVAGSEGIDIYSSGAGLQASVSGMEISGWDYGIGTGGVSGLSVNANHDAITGNATAGYDFFGGGPATNLAASNWWGAAGGPGADGANGVLGAGVVSSPWLIANTDANPGCGFSPAGDNTIAAGPAPSCISVTNTCITVPVTIARTTSDGVRGYSVTFALSSNLALCSGAASVTEGTYLSSIGGGNGTGFEVTTNPDGSYTVDDAILGLPCGVTTASGTLFTLGLKKSGADGPGTVTVTAVAMRDCANAPVAATAGAPLSITVDTSAPVAIADLAAVQKTSGNDGSGTTKTLVTFTTPTGASAIKVYRAGFGFYPEYDDAGGAVPATPGTYPPGAPWVLTTVNASGLYDQAPTRDYWYYVAYSQDACGNWSAVSNKTTGTLGYFLGDVSNGATLGQGNNRVFAEDVSLLGTHYGISLALNDTYNYLDVGPTLDYSVNTRPTTDNKVNFEDLMMFAINYNQVSAPQAAAKPAAASEDALTLGVPAMPAVGETFAVSVGMSGTGRVQGASVTLAYDPAVVAPVGVESGALLQEQGCNSVVLSPAAGTVDFALLGEGSTIAGTGEAARVVFRALSAGAPRIGVGSVVARDAQNGVVTLGQTVPQAATTPARTELAQAYPNPFHQTAAMQLSLARAGHVRVTVFDLAGRKVRTLVDSEQPAGARVLTFDGRSDAGVRLAPGVYVMRLEAAGVTQSRRVQFIP